MIFPPFGLSDHNTVLAKPRERIQGLSTIGNTSPRETCEGAILMHLAGILTTWTGLL